MSTAADPATIFGLDIDPLEENEIPLEAVVVMKVLNEDGDPCIAIRHTDGLNNWDRVGMLTVACDRDRELAQAAWMLDEEDDDG